ncbi:MAG: 2,3-bisphosphoglycerate-independent phosphoglycerate mutase, partial [Candidatus Thorarchaeota archaeon]|nr:2,3-bisphosphoglycerate-independent phosphoglycerate mutase [Candidatus Thorarchaeota archaeon]
VVLDGLPDRPLDELDGGTPLQAADTPCFDRLVAEGQTGLMHVIGPGITPGSDAAHLSLFGYDPLENYPGRGPLEALGAGIESKPGDVAFRSNFATVDSDFKVVDRRAGRQFTEEEHRILKEELDGLEIDDVKVSFVPTVQHRGAIVLRGEALSGDITDTDPHEVGVKILESKAKNEDAEKIAKVVNKLGKIAHDRFKDLELNEDRIERDLPPVNALLLRGAGQHAEIPTIETKYGIRSAAMAGGALYIGAAKYVGMEYFDVEGHIGTIDTDYENVGRQVIQCVRDGYEYIFVHLKATDNAAHDGDIERKILAIEKADSMVEHIVEAVGDQLVLAVTGDHTTPISVRDHTSDPVALLLWSDFIRADSPINYSEFDAAQGALHTILGKDLMPILLGYAGYIKKMGA